MTGEYNIQLAILLGGFGGAEERVLACDPLASSEACWVEPAKRDSSDASRLLLGATSGGSLSYTRPDLTDSGLGWAHPDAPAWNEGGISAALVDLDLDARPDWQEVPARD